MAHTVYATCVVESLERLNATMNNEGLSDEQRRALYMSLLQGLANEAQDQLCAADESHAWGPWEQTILQPDIPIFISPSDSVENMTYRVKLERQCLNCKKTQVR